MFHDNIKELTKENKNYREALVTGAYSQLVLMSIPVKQEIGEEIHDSIDQIFFVVDGDGEATVGDETFGFDEHDVVFVPAGVKHNIKNVGSKDLKLFTIYSPPAHPEGTVEKTKEEI